ncbi:MAG TPA: cysteine synthase A [Thermoanaerobaculia bacterium]|nr:cysteine synthase A [Thermoanaerobaculia bacterium]
MHGRIYNEISETIGNTPLVRLRRLPAEGSADVVVKLESFNPLSCVKERIALSMVDDAERSGALRAGGTIVEATSGNTGIGLALIAASRGYRCVLVMPDTMSIERRKLLEALGSELILTPGPMGITESQRVAELVVARTEGAWLSRQFDNPSNVQIHKRTTALEIIHDTGGEVDAVVAGVGTGGTITGVGEVLKGINPDVLIVAVEPVESQVLKGGPHGLHRIQGIAPGFIPSIYDPKVVDRIVDVTFEQSVGTARDLAKREGILAGISSGAVAWAALELGKELGRGKRVVAVLADSGERYLSTALFEYSEVVNQPPTKPAKPPAG